jgi:hypothetical protein
MYFPTSGCEQFALYELTLLGDPEMPVWSDNLGSFEVDHPSMVGTGIDYIPVNVRVDGVPKEDARICLGFGEGLYVRGSTTEAGNAFLPVSLSSSGTAELIVTGQNCRYGEGSLQVGGTPDVSLTVALESTVYQRGDTLRFTIRVENNSDTTQSVEYWTDVYFSSGDPYKKNPVYGPRTEELEPGGSVEAVVSRRIPQKAPLGTFFLVGEAGIPKEQIWDQDCLPFSVVY